MRGKTLGRKRIAAATAVAALMGGAFAGTATAAPADRDHHHGHGGPQHIFYIMMENHGYSQVIGNTQDAPYINQLAARYNTATNFHGVTHPSLPNYLSMFSGSHQGIWDDCKAGAAVTCAPEEFVPNSGDATDEALLTPAQVAAASAQPHMFDGRNLVDQLEGKGLSWKAYMQSMPSAGFEGEYAPQIGNTTVKLYAQKHNPFMYFSDINSPGNPRLQQIVPFEKNFASDLAKGTVPDFTWISPDQCHDMHGVSPSAAALINNPACGYPASGLDHGAIKLGDDFLRQTVGQIMNSRTWKDGGDNSIVIAWDENDYSGSSGGPGSPVGDKGAVLGGGDAPLIVINSDGGPHKTTAKPADHFTVLSTIEKMWHLGCLENTCSPTTSGSIRELFAR